ncbi:MAG: hypothetical protein HRU19_26200 [Pseudobacteriovorax sp.]|nr:hypothetical protein [Pseudobacteriovorax sp.]
MTIQPPSQQALSLKPQDVLNQAFALPNGVNVPNRLIKASTEELLATSQGGISDDLIRLYTIWGKLGAGLILSGNIFVSKEGRCRKGNGYISQDPEFMRDFKRLAAVGRAGGSKFLVQINHTGRQALKSSGAEAVAPSAIAVKGYGPLIKKPRELRDNEIESIIEDFVQSALTVQEAGFDGVQIHSAHGYLSSQFLSPLSNRREDRWGGALENRARFLLTVVEKVKKAVKDDFIVCVKLNSADFQRGGFSEDDSIKVASWLDDLGIDFLEISGGSYEEPAMMGLASTRSREAYFLDFAEKLRKNFKRPLLVTGGFRSAAGMASAINDGHTDLIGLARPFLVEANVVKTILQDGGRIDAASWTDRIGNKRLDAILQSVWYKREIRYAARNGRPIGPKANLYLALAIELPKLLLE